MIPKTYTLRQLRELRWQSGQGGKGHVDTFLAFLEEQEDKEEGPEMVGAICDDFKAAVRKAKERKRKRQASILSYPICVLESERDNISGIPKKRVDQLQAAIDILISEKYQLVGKEFIIEAKKIAEDKLKKKKEEPIPYVKR